MAVLMAAAMVLGLAGVVVLALVLATGGDGGAQAALAGRTLVAVAEPTTDKGLLKTVWVVSAGTGNRRAIGEADTYSAIAWSPQGNLIAALASPVRGATPSRLHILDVATGGETVVELAPNSVFPSWSPDGSRLAVVGKTIYLVTPDGVIRQQVEAPELDNVSGDGHYSGGFAWSPDGRQFGAAVNGSLFIFDGEDSVKAVPVSQLLPGTDPSTVLVGGWSNATTVTLSAAGKSFAVDVSAVELTAAQAGSDEPAGGGPSSLGPDPAAEAQVMGALRPGEIIWASRPSADGGADVFEVRVPSAPDEPARLVIRERATGGIFRVKALPLDTRGGSLYDVVVGQPD